MSINNYRYSKPTNLNKYQQPNQPQSTTTTDTPKQPHPTVFITQITSTIDKNPKNILSTALLSIFLFIPFPIIPPHKPAKITTITENALTLGTSLVKIVVSNAAN
jgi:hypothetical protein